MTTCSASVCLQLVFCMYVQAVLCFLFLAIKNCLECIFCHFHVVSLSLLGFFPCLIGGFQKWISTMQNLHYLILSPSANTQQERAFERLLMQLQNQSGFIWCLCIYPCTIQNRLKLRLHHPECINMPLILMVYTVHTQARKFPFLRKY